MILIVDDHADTGRALRSLMRVAGYPSEWVSSGAEALAFIRSHSSGDPLLVVLDEMMPQMTGMQVLRAVRADPAIAGTALIIYSASFDVAKRDEALALGAVAWLLKGGSDFDQTIRSIAHCYERAGGVKTKPRHNL